MAQRSCILGSGFPGKPPQCWALLQRPSPSCAPPHQCSNPGARIGPLQQLRRHSGWEPISTTARGDPIDIILFITGSQLSPSLQMELIYRALTPTARLSEEGVSCRVPSGVVGLGKLISVQASRAFPFWCSTSSPASLRDAQWGGCQLCVLKGGGQSRGQLRGVP